MLSAQSKGMTDGDYVYITPSLLPAENMSRRWEKKDGNDELARRAYAPLLQVK